MVIYNGIDVVEFRKKNSNPDPELLKLLPEKNDNELWFYLCWNIGTFFYDILNLLNVKKVSKTK